MVVALKDLVLGVGEYGALSQGSGRLRTLALGSCVAVIIQDSRTKTSGMVHVVLPFSNTNPGKASSMPGYFADTGILALIREMAALGCSENGRGKIVKLVGGAQILDPNNTFNIGKRNVLAVKKVLWKYRMGPVAEDVGGAISRSVTVDTESGKIVVSTPGRDHWEV